VLKGEAYVRSDDYRHWLEAQKYQAGTITAQMHRAGRVDERHGDLDEHYKRDRMASLIQALTYSTNDKRNNRPNPSNIPFDGDVYSNLASYRDAVKRYRKFRDETPEDGMTIPAPEAAGPASVTEAEVGQRIGLERDMQGCSQNRNRAA
jgi:hypothetical protein